MGEILGLGLSHYPGPMVPVQHWPSMLSRNVDHGRLAADLYADKSQPEVDNQGVAELIIGKQRNGPTGNVPVVFIKRYARFENLSREHASEG